MKQNQCIGWNLDVWPEGFKIQATQYFTENSSFTAFENEYLKLKYPFAIGFFSFHYLRAANDHDTFLQSESLQILRRLMIVCDLDTDLLKYLNASKKGNLLSFWNSIIRKLSLEAEGAINSKAKQMVKLGFCLSAVYAGLIEQLNSNNDQELDNYLRNLKEHLSLLIRSSKEANLPETLIEQLVYSEKILQRSKIRLAAHKCLKILKLALSWFLPLETSEEQIQSFL